jgi:hypothetical protein
MGNRRKALAPENKLICKHARAEHETEIMEMAVVLDPPHGEAEIVFLAR